MLKKHAGEEAKEEEAVVSALRSRSEKVSGLEQRTMNGLLKVQNNHEIGADGECRRSEE